MLAKSIFQHKIDKSDGFQSHVSKFLAKSKPKTLSNPKQKSERKIPSKSTKKQKENSLLSEELAIN